LTFSANHIIESLFDFASFVTNRHFQFRIETTYDQIIITSNKHPIILNPPQITEDALDCTTFPCKMDLKTACYNKGGERRQCPPVIIFEGEIRGTLELEKCDVGVIYTFVNL
jgi:hypothetical protein